MPKGSEALTNARKEEIVNACALLYQTMGFREITIRDIGAKTSFTRTSIYNYFQTKEEIFLALLEREHAAWAADLDAVCAQHDVLDADGFADALARTLEKRGWIRACGGGASRLEYVITPDGLAAARAELERLRTLAATAEEILEGVNCNGEIPVLRADAEGAGEVAEQDGAPGLATC